MKAHYRRHFVQHGLLKAMEKKEDVNWTLLDAIHGIQAAWSKVSAKTIKNCFGHCGFVEPGPATTGEDFDEEDEIPLAELRTQLHDAGMAVTDEEWDVFQDVDAQLLTSAPLSTDDIVEEVKKKKAADEPELEDEDDEEKDDPAPTPKPRSLADFMDAATLMKDQMCTLDEDMTQALECIIKAESLFVKAYSKKKSTQKTMKDFMSVFKPAPLAALVESASQMEDRT